MLKEGTPTGQLSMNRNLLRKFLRILTPTCFPFLTELHKERLQNFAVGGSGMTQPKEDALEHLMLEEELELQLGLLKEHAPDATLFPDDEAELKAMPHLKDDAAATQKEHHDEGLFHKPTPYEIYELEETVLEENLMEPFLVRILVNIFFICSIFFC